MPDPVVDRVALLIDPQKTVGAVGSSRPPKHFRPIPAKRQGVFPGVKVTTARAVVYRYTGLDESCELLDGKGGLCPNVHEPQVDLTAEQLERTLQLVRGASIYSEQSVTPSGATRKAKRPVLRCDFNPHHAIVFYQDDQPVGTLEVCFECGQWLATPEVAAANGESVMVETEVRFFGELFEQLKLPVFPPDTTTSQFEAALSRVRAQVRLSLSETAIGDTPPAERPMLCARAEALLYGQPWVGRSFRCPGGFAWTGLAWRECVARFPTACPSASAQVFDCIERLTQVDAACADEESIKAACPSPCGLGFALE